MTLRLIDSPPLGAVAKGVAGLWALEAQGFSPDGNLLLVKAVYSDSAYPLLPSRAAYWMYDLTQGRYVGCVNDLIAADRSIEVSDVSVGNYSGQIQLVATYRDTDASSGLDLNQLALIRDGVLVQADLALQVSGNQADALITAVKATANGRFVAIETAASNLAAELDTNGCKDIYLFDLLLNTSRRVTTINGVESGFDSVLGDVMVGVDGSVSLTFQSSQAFTAQDANGSDDVFLWRMTQAEFGNASAGTMTLVSRTLAGAAGGSNPQLNMTGVVFSSDSGAFSPTDLNGVNDVWQAGGAALALVTASAGGVLSQATDLASSSDGGRYVAVVTAAPEVAGQLAVGQLVIVDTLAHSSVIVSKSAAGALADDAVISPVLSADGTRVAFSSQASNLSAGPADGQMHLFVADTLLLSDVTEFNRFAAVVPGQGVTIGTAENDVLHGYVGADNLIGGVGNDTYYVDTQGDLVFENPGEGMDTVVTAVSFYLYDNIENLTLAAGAGDIFGSANALDNSLSGNEAANLLLGWDGNDSISGNAGNDILFGVEGNDSLLGGAGIDFLAGGNGNDTLDGGADSDAVYGESGNDLLYGGTGFVTDILIAGDGNDTLDGSASAASGQLRNQGDYDLMDGGAGDDTYCVDTPADLTFEAIGGGVDSVIADINGGGYYLYANVENLTLIGNTPFGVGNELNNVLVGSDLANWLLGGAGNDTLNGHGGNDVLFGEAGADTFVFEHGTGGDVIGDFTHGTDKINLVGIGFGSYAQLRSSMVENGGTTAIDLGQGDFVVLVAVPMASLSAGDFVLA